MELLLVLAGFSVVLYCIFQSHSEKNNPKKNIEIKGNDKDKNVYGAGRYIGGVDIPCGFYNLKILSGTGIVQTKHPNDVFVRLESDEKVREKRNWPEEYNGLEITKDTNVEISENARIKFVLYRKLKDENKENEGKNKNENSEEISELNDLISQQQQEISMLRNKMEHTNSQEKKDKISEISIEGIGKGNLLEAGSYKAGVDFPEGKYDFYALKGKGNLSCTKGDVWQNMSETPKDSSVRKYRNLYISKGSRIEISGNLQVLMYYSRPIEPKHRNFGEGNIISAGDYKVGSDIPAGKYILEVKRGNGYVEDGDEICINLGEKNINDVSSKARVLLRKGKTLTVDGDMDLYLYEAETIEIIKKEYKFGEKNNVLCGGTYEAGIDIPYGYYNIKLVDGSGSFELENDDGLDFCESFSEKETKEYSNLLIKIGDKVIVESGLEVSMEFSKPYINENISKGILRELDDLRKELSILNNQTIGKYYNFSAYEQITSEECKNKLMLLKQDEKHLRENEGDVKVGQKDDVSKPIKERIVRKMLRTFNSECDNIIFNVGIKNIDQSRKKIQQSFETLNKLYSVDGVELTQKILELKLEQITLMYTYELKYQQEKDIQKAIKEQMIEEAKAQREIEEQKKKIEKDLQQHLSEINRMMKYMQKTQIDAEKQLYMDKIKELEEKIRILESDKETVLQREANAKAGFVYIISNIGSFGENIYKIGMTRRLEPMDRIKELSSASVPFEFDVHAMIFSSDAPELETTLHKHFADNAVNKVNPRKEFYKVDIDEIEKVVKESYNDTVQFTKIPIASEYRQSLNMQKIAL